VFVTNNVVIGVVCVWWIFFWFTTVSTFVAAVEVYLDARGRGKLRMKQHLPSPSTFQNRHSNIDIIVSKYFYIHLLLSIACD
jgi:hypothetical protein